MYGMVNQAILEYVRETHGEATLQAVQERADSRTTAFTSMQQYPDAESVGLVGAAAEVLGESPAQILEEIGAYWIGFALRSDYGNLLRAAGRTLPEVLGNLDNLHTRVGQAFPDLRPPSFWCDEVTDRSLVLHYASDREGLAPMVVGLVRGLGEMLDVRTNVEPIEDSSASHARFRVAFSPPCTG